MNVHVSAFGRLSNEQINMIRRAIQIRQQEYDLHIEIQTISRELGYQGINLWEEIREWKESDTPERNVNK